MSLPGLPPLPKSLSSANLDDNISNSEKPAQSLSSSSSTNSSVNKLPPPPPAPKQPPPPPPRKQTKLDVQLTRLRKEMYNLRELDLSLLSQLWSLNEAIQEYRTVQEMISPNSPSSDVEDDAIYSNLAPLREQSGYALSVSSDSSNEL